ncbi:hypothetical protein M9458_041729 [Cirrhinus mrigala]|uniref:Uncharacterized protein n=1 Tax=Cirrhinus mrigala TaxID=683832 RepID=A0ABD0NPS4_CIRMR
MFTTPRDDTLESSHPIVKEMKMPYSDSPFPQDNSERSCNGSDTTESMYFRSLQSYPRHGDWHKAMNTEHGSQSFPRTYTIEQRSSILHYQGQPFAAEGPKAKLAVFDGSGDWKSFLVPFEHQARKYGWSGDYRVGCLYDYLRVSAIKYVCSLPEHIREDYTLLKEQLTRVLVSAAPATTIRRKLGDFAEKVQRLVTLAYPGVELDLQDQLATDFFLMGLCNQKVAYEVMNKNPHSLVKAQRLVEAHEHNYQATVGHDIDVKSRARRISWADDEELSTDSPAGSRRVLHYCRPSSCSLTEDCIPNRASGEN